MKVQCINKNCQTVFEINDQRLPLDRPKKLRCSYCRTVFYVERTADGGAPVDISDAEYTMLLNLSNRNRENDPPSFEQYVVQKRAARQVNILPLASHEPSVELPLELVESVPEPSLPFMVPPPPQQAPAAGHGAFQKVVAPLAKKADMLLKTQWLPDLTQEDYMEFAQYWEVYFGAATCTLFKPKERNSFFCIIYNGEVGLYRSQEDYEKKGHPLVQLGRGSGLGEQAIFRVYPRNMFAVLEKDTYLLLLTRKQAREMAVHHPRLWQAMATKLLLQLSEIVEQMVSPEQLEVFSVMSKALAGRS